MSSDIKVVLVEELERRAGLRKLIGNAQLNLIGEAGFGQEAITVVHPLQPLRPQELHRAALTLLESENRRHAALEGEGKPLHQGDVISVFGVKGGIGKTSLAVNLAAAIAAQTKQRVG